MAYEMDNKTHPLQNGITDPYGSLSRGNTPQYPTVAMFPEVLREAIPILIGGIPELITELIYNLARHNNAEVRMYAVSNIYLPDAMVVMMQDDSSPEVREIVTKRIQLMRAKHEPNNT
jgi:hypothetical protein